MFRPNITGKVWKRSASRDIFGQESYGPPTSFRCGVVHLKVMAQQTTVRADSSASRGAGEETVAGANIMVPPSTIIRPGDKIEIVGVAIEVTGLEPRLNTRGQLDHYQVFGKIKGD